MSTQFKRRRRPGRFVGQKWPTHPAVGLAIAQVIAPGGSSTDLEIIWSTETTTPPAAVPPGWQIDGQTPTSITAPSATLWVVSVFTGVNTGASWSFPPNADVQNLAGQAWAGGSGTVA